MTVLDRDLYFLFLQTQHIERYWDLVKSIIEYVFKNTDPKQADDLRFDVSQSPVEEQVLFYHASPIDVAADLLDITPTADHYLSYGKLLKKFSWDSSIGPSAL